MSYHQEPTVFQKLKMGAMMGGTVGLCIGLVFGTVSVLRYGPGPNGYVRTLGQYMGSSAASFAFFMAIGTVIRTEENQKQITSSSTSVPSGSTYNRRLPILINNSRFNMGRGSSLKKE
ncbi:reactive mitochondrial oxygen species modulator 1-domain-containing protein [Paraphysoderma sedebokerense]|nr:reactive mitochondrial oxygen species modulator 1-domain-containing protein [Paraphysoderma sedebokerense]